MEGISTPTPAAQAAAQAPAAAAAVAATAATDKANPPAKSAASSAAANGPVATRSTMEVDKATGRVVGRIINTKTGDIVDQFPSKEMLRLLARTREMLGHLFDEKA